MLLWAKVEECAHKYEGPGRKRKSKVNRRRRGSCRCEGGWILSKDSECGLPGEQAVSEGLTSALDDESMGKAKTENNQRRERQRAHRARARRSSQPPLATKAGTSQL